jgi:hypothetical protein
VLYVVCQADTEEFIGLGIGNTTQQARQLQPKQPAVYISTRSLVSSEQKSEQSSVW